MSLFGDGAGTIYDRMLEFFQEDDWHFEPMEDKPILRMRFKGDNGSWRCYAQARDEQEMFIFYSVLEANVPSERRLATAEFLTRANFGLFIGNFEMDFSDGEVRYKTSLKCDAESLSSVLMKHLVYINVLMMDRYFPGLMAVMFAGKSPTEAIADIEDQS